jgi:hypothetical protein
VVLSWTEHRQIFERILYSKSIDVLSTCPPAIRAGAALLEELTMTKRPLFAGLLIGLALLSFASPGLAQAERVPGGDVLARMEQEGWTVIQEGVLQRQPEPGEVETFVFGVAGFTWKLRDLRSQLQVLRREYQARPTPELRRAIASHRRMIASTQERIERARAAEAGSKWDIWEGGCNLNYALDAEAAHKVNVQGTWAAAGADFNASASCAYGGEVYAYAFAQTTVNGGPTTATVTDGPRTGANVSASADAHRNGGPTCESYASSSVTSDTLELTSYSKSKTNTACPAASSPSTLQVSVTADYDGQAEVTIWEERCVTITWQVNVSGGTPFYTANIYRNGVFQRTGTSYSEQFCFDQDYEAKYVEYADVTISAQVTDSGGQSSSASNTKALHYRWLIY